MKGGVTTDQKKIGSLLKELRNEKGLTQEQLAETLNVSSRTVSRWETGSSMPDISLLVDIAEFYDVNISEIIKGERKSEKMNEEVKEVAETMSNYAGAEKETLIKNVRNLSIIGFCALVVYSVIEITGAVVQNEIFGKVYLYCETLIFVTTIMIPLYTTGLLGKIKRKNSESKLPKSVMALAAVIIAATIAIAIKLVITMIFS